MDILPNNFKDFANNFKISNINEIKIPEEIFELNDIDYENNQKYKNINIKIYEDEDSIIKIENISIITKYNKKNKNKKKNMINGSINFQINNDQIKSLTYSDNEINKNLFETNRFCNTFKNIKKIGIGAYGQVFRAVSNLDETEYAIKIIEFDWKTDEIINKNNSFHELLTLAKLNQTYNHKNIIKYNCCWLELENEFSISLLNEDNEDEESDDIFEKNIMIKNNVKKVFLHIQMEYCKQGTLKDLMDKTELSRKQIFSIISQIIDALEYIHENNIIHRDLKPDNIFIANNGIIKIADFSIAKNLNISESIINKNLSLGTEIYKAPEQNSKNIYNGKVDIFSLGLIYLEMLLKMKTMHEKIRLFSDIKKGKPIKSLIDEKIYNLYNREILFMEKLVNINQSNRLDINEIKSNQEFVELLNINV